MSPLKGRVWRESPSTGLSYRRAGNGRPVVLLHGWCLNSSMWTYAEELLIGEYDVIIPDLPGFGRSAALNGPYNLERYAADVAALLTELNVNGVVLIGFAFGAAVAMASAALSGERITKVISVAMPDPAASPYERMPKSMRRDWPDFARRSAEALFLKHKSAATIAWVEREFGSTSLRVAIEVCSLLQKLDAPALASAAGPVPQIYIHSTADNVAPVAFGNKCAGSAEKSEVIIIEGSGHLIVLDDKEAFHGILSDSLRKAEG